MEITLPNTHRWIPKSMKINYLAKANTHLRGQTHIAINDLPDAGGFNVLVEVFDQTNRLVVTSDIEMYVSKRKS